MNIELNLLNNLPNEELFKTYIKAQHLYTIHCFNEVVPNFRFICEIIVNNHANNCVQCKKYVNIMLYVIETIKFRHCINNNLNSNEVSLQNIFNRLFPGSDYNVYWNNSVEIMKEDTMIESCNYDYNKFEIIFMRDTKQITVNLYDNMQKFYKYKYAYLTCNKCIKPKICNYICDECSLIEIIIWNLLDEIKIKINNAYSYLHYNHYFVKFGLIEIVRLLNLTI